MSSRTVFDRRLLGGLSPSTFLARHWQKRPLLIRGAVEAPMAMPDRDALFALAMRDDVESRLVTSFAGRWSMTHGPLDRLPRRKQGWTLLVQGVNLHDARADALMRRFDFVSTLRLDDLMVSYAVDGGSVGPHVDSYDVFLLQVSGRRRWRWQRNAARDPAARALVDDVPLKLLARFEPDEEALLEPGDMLYLPPDCAHEGVADGACVTASIGFRAPAWQELTREFLFDRAERVEAPGLYADRDRSASRTPSRIDDAFADAVFGRLARIRWTRDDAVDFIGRYFSEPKADVFFDPPRPQSQDRVLRAARRAGIALDRKATLLYRGRAGFIAGERVTLPAAGRVLLRALADRRRLPAAQCATLLEDAESAALVHDWWSHGWIHIDRGGDPDEPV